MTKQPDPNLDLWALWPEDFMCPMSEVHLFSHRSDDFEIVNVTAYDTDDEPSRWERRKKE